MKTNINTAINIFIFLPLIKPVGLVYNNPFLNLVFQLWKLLSILFMFLMIVKETNALSELIFGDSLGRKGILGLLVFEVIYLLDTIIRGVGFFDLLNNCITCQMLMIYILVMSKTKYRKTMYMSIDIVFSMYLVLQIISMVLERLNVILLRADDGSPTYFFGPDNYSAFFIIPMLGVLLYLGCGNSKRIRFRKKDVALLVSLTICYVWTGSVTAACSLLILTVASMLISANKITARAFSIIGLIVLLAFALVLILGFDIQNYFTSLFRFVGKGEKGISLNSRTYIWEQSLHLIKDHFLFGVGDLSESEISNYVLYGASHAHNILLELMLRSGIIGTIGYLFFMTYPLVRYKKYFLHSKNATLLIFVFAYLVLSFMDFYPLIQAPIFLFSFVYICAEDMKRAVILKRKCEEV